jgi:translation initiation factor 3 subunit B
MSDIEWDPTGRYLVTYVCNWNFKGENAYIMWNFQGKQLQKHSYDKLFKFSWRPRPVPLLNEEHKKVCF